MGDVFDPSVQLNRGRVFLAAFSLSVAGCSVEASALQDTDVSNASIGPVHVVTGALATPVLAGPPDFVAIATSNTHMEGFVPAGFWLSQYEVWIAIPSGLQPNAGVIVAAGGPVYLSTNGVITADTAADILPGDSIQVWRNTQVAYGSVQAPPGAPAYSAKQVVIVWPRK